MHYILFIFMLLPCNLHEKQKALINTKWEYKVAEGCVSYITFKKNGTYENYNCEMDYPYSGKYEIKNDTIYLLEIDLESNVPSINKRNNYKKVITRRSKLVNKGDSLWYVSWEAFENKKWSKPITPPNEIFYKKK
ncbi:hypothetical protein BA6E_102175 [Bacteroidales bacterium 6E]|nr:hypothetical protein BA6E_102175 [Bacteroidales bacterium 6E]